MTEKTAVEELVARAQQSVAVTRALMLMQQEMESMFIRLDKALADEQTDPGEVGQQVVRSMVLRGTVDSVAQAALQGMRGEG